MAGNQKIAVVGAGPVGSLAALYAAKRGHDVEVYELRADLRYPSTIPLNFTKSINLALSERGINAMRHSGEPKLLEHVIAITIPMRGRMVHGLRPDGSLYEEPQNYDNVYGRSILAIDRGRLNKRMLDILEAMPNVTFFFQHKLTGANLKAKKAWFEVQGGGGEEKEIDFDLMIGADGSHSVVRYHLMKYARMDYKQEYVDTLWCEFSIKAGDVAPGDTNASAKFKTSPNHLHIWPGKQFMFIAIPSEDGTFTCTLFAPGATFSGLEQDPSTRLIPFFEHYFPGVTSLIPPAELLASFHKNPHLPLISIKCKPYHFGSAAVLVGDAAHAMVPFYGQGMNSGLEDVRILFAVLDQHTRNTEAGLAAYTAVRVPDAHAINDLALQNYTEMCASVLSPAYRLRKALEEAMARHFPDLGWQTRYARISFGNERYSEVVARTEYQGNMLMRGFLVAVGLPLLAGGALLWYRFGREVEAGAACLGRELAKAVSRWWA